MTSRAANENFRPPLSLVSRLFSGACCTAPLPHPDQVLQQVEADRPYIDSLATTTGNRDSQAPACRQALLMQPLELHGCGVWCNAAIATCQTGDEVATARLKQVSVAAIRGCGMDLNFRTHKPTFSVPLGVNVNEVDSARSMDAVRTFTSIMQDGTFLRIAIEGMDDLPVEATMSEKMDELELAFNGVKKKLSMKMVRSVSLNPVPFSATSSPLSPKVAQSRKASDYATWQVHLELEDNSFCVFAFAGTDVGMEEASFFGSCMLILAEGARFEAVRLDLASQSFPVAGPHDISPRKSARNFASTASTLTLSAQNYSGPVSPDSDVVTTVPQTVLTARSEPSVCGEVAPCVLDGKGGEHLVAALLAAGATPYVQLPGQGAFDPHAAPAPLFPIRNVNRQMPPAAGPAVPPPTKLVDSATSRD